jgi:hypothetical protein
VLFAKIVALAQRWALPAHNGGATVCHVLSGLITHKKGETIHATALPQRTEVKIDPPEKEEMLIAAALPKRDSYYIQIILCK